MNIVIGKTSGFCNGVENTVKRAEDALSKEKVYCLGEIVHNERVINDLESKGMITINNIDEAPNNSKVIIRAHGELKETYDKAQEKNIEVIYSCGPTVVLKNVARIAKENSIKSYVAMEKVMACSIGVCRGCVIRLNKNDEIVYGSVCQDGPVFEGSEVVWE